MHPSFSMRMSSMIASTCLLVLAIALPSGCREAPGTPEAIEPPLAVRTAPVQAGTLKRKVRAIGTIHSVEELRIMARVSGRVGSLPVPEGGSVAPGDLLVELLSPETGARSERVYQERGRAGIEAAFLCRQADEDEELARAQAITRQKAAASREACRAAGKAVASVGAQLREQSLLAGNLKERAPFAGIVLRWIAQPGENIMPGQPILTIGGEAMEVRVPVPEEDLVKGIAPGLTVELGFPDGARQTSTVRHVAPGALGPTRTAEVRIGLKRTETATWRHGMSVEVAFVLEESARSWIVPSSAVRTTEAGSHVYVVTGQALSRREVFSKLTVPPWTAVTGKLSVTDRVVTDRLAQLRDGLPVWVAPHAEVTP